MIELPGVGDLVKSASTVWRESEDFGGRAKEREGEGSGRVGKACPQQNLRIISFSPRFYLPVGVLP